MNCQSILQIVKMREKERGWTPVCCLMLMAILSKVKTKMMVPRESQAYTCSDCSFVADNMERLNMHNRDQHIRACMSCHFQVESMPSLRKHQLEKHNKAGAVPNSTLLNCNHRSPKHYTRKVSSALWSVTRHCNLQRGWRNTFNTNTLK